MAYPHLEVEQKWQKRWEDEGCFQAQDDFTKPKYYALNMFPYPSAAGLHCGHLASYTPTDVLSRYRRACGYNVLQPFGYDAFGLPAEQHAIQTGTHPEITTRTAIENFRKQLKSFGFSYDWSREISTCDKSYYKWTQKIFKELYQAGLCYQKEVPVNWCPALKTVLANDEVINGKSERGGHDVIRVPMRQWVLKITEYSEQLLSGLEGLDWPERTREGQKNWIGKSTGARLAFLAKGPDGGDHKIEVFTTRPDTLFGVSYLVLAPEHSLVSQLTTSEQSASVQKYIELAAKKSDVDRQAQTEKTGIFTGSYATHPLSQQKVPVWISDYVLADYGTGAVMGVPAHDARDFEFATAFGLEIKQVVRLTDSDELPMTAKEGVLIHSGPFDGIESTQAAKAITVHLQKSGLGMPETQYKLRDWVFSRQRYWGEPFPIVHGKDGQIHLVSDDELPVSLPEINDYEPTDDGEAPLSRAKDWVAYNNSATGIEGERETHTMPGAAGSSWYFLRYTDPHNDHAAFDFEKQKYWMPVDFYFGGPEHTVGHLLYARFWQRVLFERGLVSHPEPFQRLMHQGMILGPDGEKMSKSRGNTVSPDQVRDEYGADATRIYILFLGPVEKDKPWATSGIEGSKRFLERVYRLVRGSESLPPMTDEPLPLELQKKLHKTIAKVTEDIEAMRLNTAVSAMMILTNELYKAETRSKPSLKVLVQLLQPFAPHLAEELWEVLGEKGLVSLAAWPQANPELLVDDLVVIGVQVNGKMRGQIEISPTATEEEALQLAHKLTSVETALESQQIAKVIYKPGKILNLVSRPK